MNGAESQSGVFTCRSGALLYVGICAVEYMIEILHLEISGVSGLSRSCRACWNFFADKPDFVTREHFANRDELRTYTNEIQWSKIRNVGHTTKLGASPCTEVGRELLRPSNFSLDSTFGGVWTKNRDRYRINVHVLKQQHQCMLWVWGKPNNDSVKLIN